MIQFLKKSIIFTSILAYSVSMSSQQKLLDIANEEYRLFEYTKAQKNYLKLVDKGYEDVGLLKNLGNTYYFNSQFEDALIWYKKLIESYGGEIESEYYFRYAQTLKSIDDYKGADLYMEAFAKMSPDDSRAKDFLINRNILKNSTEFSKLYKIKKLAMNSSYRDFGSTYYGDSIILSSSRMNPEIESKDVHEWNDEPYLDMYIVKRDSLSGELYELKKWESKFNTVLHESTPIFSKDLKTVYYTGNTIEKGKVRKIKKGKLETNKLKIYISSLNKKGEWTKPEALPFCKDDYSVAHPALSKDGNKLYFSSDMPGGFGESDIYSVDINPNGTFGIPTNLGNKINTEGKETFPFIGPENVLYFSSDGHVGYGGLDVFKVSLNNVDIEDSVILNMGAPVNSVDDDFCFVIDSELKSGYFSSNRPSGEGKDDIYSFKEIEFGCGDDLTEKLELAPIYFDLDKSFIRFDASVVLDKVLDVLKRYPTMKIHIRSHTDSRASKTYNIALSERRAQSTMLYLIKNGIEKSRLTSVGLGEFELVNHCSDGVKCTEDEHQQNRRSEFIITEL